ncbi:hypothetical protein Leryth_022153 [Lithospermum erythrorhizon]|nr:hypothetical protein Leryth_022153 [Lithospermum erythrorhizon]
MIPQPTGSSPSLPRPLGPPPLPSTPQNTTLQCPLDFTILLRLAEDSQPPKVDTPTQCQYVLQGIRLVLSVYLKNTNSPPL